MHHKQYSTRWHSVCESYYMMFRIFNWRRFVLFVFVLFGGCNTLQTLIKPSLASPHQQYLNGLAKSDLITTSMVKTWLKAGEVSHHDSIQVTLPYQETGFFTSTEPTARFYRFEVEDGQVLTLTAVLKTKENGRLFANIFTLQEDGWKELAHVDSSLNLTHEFAKSGSCLVRLQPELLVNMYYSLTLSVTPVLLNPVKGASNKSIGSFYGDPRDGGKRKHEGVDIFAPKGTFVIAPTDGVVSRVGNNSLGGKIVWMNDLKRGHSYYFAHLDAQFVKPGAKVKQGDVLGTVGTTGNAHDTPSHLHFGIFQRSSKDPVTYIRTMENLVNALAPDTLFQSMVFRVNEKNTALHVGPEKKLPIREQLTMDTYVKVIAQSKDWYRVITADEQEGYIERSHVIPAEKGNRFVIKKQILLLSEANRDAVPVSILRGPVEGLASFKNFRFVKTHQGLTGWIDLSVL